MKPHQKHRWSFAAVLLFCSMAFANSPAPAIKTFQIQIKTPILELLIDHGTFSDSSEQDIKDCNAETYASCKETVKQFGEKGDNEGLVCTLKEFKYTYGKSVKSQACQATIKDETLTGTKTPGDYAMLVTEKPSTEKWAPTIDLKNLQTWLNPKAKTSTSPNSNNSAMVSKASSARNGSCETHPPTLLGCLLISLMLLFFLKPKQKTLLLMLTLLTPLWADIPPPPPDPSTLSNFELFAKGKLAFLISKQVKFTEKRTVGDIKVNSLKINDVETIVCSSPEDHGLNDFCVLRFTATKGSKVDSWIQVSDDKVAK